MSTGNSSRWTHSNNEDVAVRRKYPIAPSLQRSRFVFIFFLALTCLIVDLKSSSLFVNGEQSATRIQEERRRRTTTAKTVLEQQRQRRTKNVQPNSYKEGEPIPLKVNKLTSSHDLYRLDYYRLPFCQPTGGPAMDNESYGEFLAGDRLESTPYNIRMKRDLYCELLCVANLGDVEHAGFESNSVARAIHNNYHNNWMLDGLPAASRLEDDTTVTTRYWQGFPIGFVDDSIPIAYIHNHVNLQIVYHPSETDEGSYQVVRFTAQPFSIRHEFNVDDYGYAEITNPIQSCRGSYQDHTNYDMISKKFQPASGNVLFTYDVIWTESRELKWADRWEVYVYMDGAIPDKIHWIPCMVFGLLSMALLACLAALVTKHLMNHHRYQSVLLRDQDGENGFGASSGSSSPSMEALFQDILLPPMSAPFVLAICCGTGAQVLSTILIVVVFGWHTFLIPEHFRATILSCMTVSFSMSGIVGGYVSARLVNTFSGRIEYDMESTTQREIALGTVLVYPGICFATFLVINVTALVRDSTLAASLETVIITLLLWFAIATPLTIFGVKRGMRDGPLFRGVIVIPSGSVLRRPVPTQPRYMSLPATIIMSGFIPFLSIFVEVYFILSAAWLGYSYYTFGFLMVTCLICCVLIGLITIFLLFWQYQKGNHLWWWRSFWNGASIGLYLFGYSLLYYKQLGASSAASWALYHAYMAVLCCGTALAGGFCGVICSLCFNVKMAQSLKVAPTPGQDYAYTSTEILSGRNVPTAQDEDHMTEGFELMDDPIHHIATENNVQ